MTLDGSKGGTCRKLTSCRMSTSHRRMRGRRPITNQATWIILMRPILWRLKGLSITDPSPWMWITKVTTAGEEPATLGRVQGIRHVLDSSQPDAFASWHKGELFQYGQLCYTDIEPLARSSSRFACGV